MVESNKHVFKKMNTLHKDMHLKYSGYMPASRAKFIEIQLYLYRISMVFLPNIYLLLAHLASFFCLASRTASAIEEGTSTYFSKCML